MIYDSEVLFINMISFKYLAIWLIVLYFSLPLNFNLSFLPIQQTHLYIDKIYLKGDNEPSMFHIFFNGAFTLMLMKNEDFNWSNSYMVT